jgi:hypothetical protein
MAMQCPRCSRSNPDVARFCRHCGLVLKLGARGPLGPGHVPHPEPAAVPSGFEPIAGSENLYFHWTALGGGRPLLGTEPLALQVINVGYGLREVVLRVTGSDENGRALCTLEREIAEWLFGVEVDLEIASYELPDRVRALQVELVQAEFAAEDA